MKVLEFALSIALIAGLIGNCAIADTIRLVNGDTLSGQVESLDAESLVITSDVLGELTIKRAKVQAIQFGEGGLKPLTEQHTPQAQPDADAPLQRILGQVGGEQLSG